MEPFNTHRGPAKRKEGSAVASQTHPNAKGASGRLARDPWRRMPIWKSPSYFTACLRAERTAASMALLVTVAPATPSIWSLWAASTCWA